MNDPRYLSGPAMIVIGTFLVALAWRMWTVPPVNLVLRFGPFVTEEGIKAVLGMRVYIFALGAFLLVWGMSSTVFWWFAGADVNAPAVVFLGTLGTGLGFWAAILSAFAAYKLWLAE